MPWLLDLIQLFRSEGCVEEFILVEGNFCVMSKVKVSVFCRWCFTSLFGAVGTENKLFDDFHPLLVVISG